MVLMLPIHSHFDCTTFATLTGTVKTCRWWYFARERTALTGMSGTVDTSPSLGLTPTATASAPTGSQGALYYDSDKAALMQYGAAWNPVRFRKFGTGV